MKCEYLSCENLLSVAQEKNGQRFCCRSCSNAGVKRLASAASRNKVSNALTGASKKNVNWTPVSKICPSCNQEFSLPFGRRQQKTCSVRCGKLLGGKTSAKAKTERGTHSGWHNRRMEPSYPEKYFIALFKTEGISGYCREMKVGRWFIDFAFIEQKLAVEIDGRQHVLWVTQDAIQKAI